MAVVPFVQALESFPPSFVGPTGPHVAMPSIKVGFSRNPEYAGLFDEHDPERLYTDLREIVTIKFQWNYKNS